MSEPPPKAPPETSAEGEILVALVGDNRLSREEHAKLLNATPGVMVIHQGRAERRTADGGRDRYDGRGRGGCAGIG